jgi:AAA domain, putative AbiEii toxin, Type IV TA system
MIARFGARNKDAALPTLTGLHIEGFKSIAKPLDIRLAPITVLAGPNSSGKSSLMQPLLLIKQTLEASYDPGPLLLSGPNVRFSAADQLLSRTSSNRADQSRSFAVKVTLANAPGNSFELIFARERSKRLGVSRTVGEFGTTAVTLKEHMSSEEVWAAVRKTLDDATIEVYRNFFRIDDTSWRINRERCFLVPENRDLGTGGSASVMIPNGMTILQAAFSTALVSMIHLPGLRGNPSRAYEVAAVGAPGQKFQGPFTPYAASVIAYWQEADESGHLRALGKDLEHLDLTWKVEARRIGETQVELQVGRLKKALRGGAKDLVNIVDVGFGLSQSLPFLVALHAASAGDLVYVEQPEIHLHPNAQYRLAALVFAAAERGVRFVIETHSSLFIIGLQVLIAERAIDPGRFALHWLTRDRDGISEVTTADIAPDGSLGEWPSDFDEVLMRAQGDYLSAVARQSFGAAPVNE